jgi:hypothetical protein
MRFIVGKLTEEELKVLRRGESIISKLLLIPQDFPVFHYQEGDLIEAETQDGNRIWTKISSMEVVENQESVIIILSLVHETPMQNSHLSY